MASWWGSTRQHADYKMPRATSFVPVTGKHVVDCATTSSGAYHQGNAGLLPCYHKPSIDHVPVGGGPGLTAQSQNRSNAQGRSMVCPNRKNGCIFVSGETWLSSAFSPWYLHPADKESLRAFLIILLLHPTILAGCLDSFGRDRAVSRSRARAYILRPFEQYIVIFDRDGCW